MAENAEKVLSAEPAPPKWLRVLGAYRQWVLFAAGLLLFAGVISLVFWLQDDDWRPVYAGLSEKDAAAVVQALQQERIPYRVKEGAVLVPADQVHIARIRLAGRGVAPEGGVGFELFDRANEFGLSEFTRRINLQRALQGELARTIEVIPQVASARVHIVLPKRSPFAGEERRASASVMLRLIGDLPKRAVVAIQNLVAASVPDLAPEDVVVVDASGHLLSQPKGEAQAEVATIDERQAALERRIERRLTTMLEQIVGPGQAVARVSVEMDRAYLEAHERHVNPDEVLARHERARNETRTRSEAQPIGVPGVASNTPGANPAQQAAAQNRASRNERDVEYDYSASEIRRIVPAGAVRRLSVAVVVGGSVKDGKFVPRSNEELKRIEAIVKRAVGFDEDRGDVVTVESMPIVDVASFEDQEALAKAERMQLVLKAAKYLTVLAVVGLLVWFVLRPLAGQLAAPPARPAPQQRSQALPGEEELPALSSEAYRRLASMEMAKRAIEMDPERAKRVLREWVEHG